jgi:hypothetical protein
VQAPSLGVQAKQYLTHTKFVEPDGIATPDDDIVTGAVLPEPV